MVLLQNFKKIILNSAKIRPIISRCFIPSSFYISRSFASLEDLYKPFSISRTFQADPETLTIEFSDSLEANFYYLWLRDSCNCNKCVSSSTGQKYLDTLSLDLKIAPRFCHVTNTGKLKLVWPEGYGDHVSYYHPSMLHKYASGFKSHLYESVHDFLPPVQHWTSEYLKANLPQLDYEEVMQSQKGILSSLENIHKLGILFLKNVPCELGEIIKVINRIANVKNTRWGSSFHITSDERYSQKASVPYTETNVELRTDMDYLEKSPGIQAMHCIDVEHKNSSNSSEDENAGEFYFVDGFCVANLMKEQQSMLFETLTSVPIKFRLFSQNMFYMNYQPMFKLNKSRDITEVHFNNRLTAPLEGPSRSIYSFYAAYKMFGENVRNPKSQFRIQLKPGDMVILNNRRVLHGRRRFDPRHMTRHLEGCYADMDEVLARYRSLLQKRAENLK